MVVASAIVASLMARWRSCHFTAVNALEPQEVELGHSKVRSFMAVVVSCAV